MRAFLFITMRRPEVTARLIRAARATSSTIVLDLEDTLWDPTDEARTKVLKAAGRGNLVAFAREFADLFADQRIGVRVNRWGGRYSDDDLEALGQASRFVEFDAVVLPKADRPDDLLGAVEALRASGVAHRGVIPILETRQALADLDAMLAAAGGAGAGWVVYGHYDFALDSGWWPFPDQLDDEFWQFVEPLVARIEAVSLSYIHPPYLRIDDDEGLVAILHRLRRITSREFGILAVARRQASVAANLEQPGRPSGEGRIGSSAPSAGDPLSLARQTVAVFEANRKPGTGFAIDPGSGEFISPQMYVAARRMIGSNHA